MSLRSLGLQGNKNRDMVKNLCNVLYLISKLSQKLRGKLNKLTDS